ncbi:DUF365 domain-containing protein [Archaeoglobus fulgidus]
MNSHRAFEDINRYDKPVKPRRFVPVGYQYS